MENIDPTHIPEDVLGEILFKMKIEDILRLKNTSKNWEYVIDNLWCRLLERDFKVKMKDKCDIKYKELYEIKDLMITEKQIESAIKKYKLDVSSENITYILEKNGFKKMNNEWIYVPQIFSYKLLHRFFAEYMNGNIDSNLVDVSAYIDIYPFMSKILKDIIPKQFVFKETTKADLEVYIPFDSLIKGYNYARNNRFDEIFLEEAIDYLNKEHVIKGKGKSKIKIKKSLNPELDAENMLKKFHQVANY